MNSQSQHTLSKSKGYYYLQYKSELDFVRQIHLIHISHENISLIEFKPKLYAKK